MGPGHQGSDGAGSVMSAAPAAPSGTVTFLFTDVQGSSDLAERHPDVFQGLLDRHRALLSEAVHAHRGLVFEIVGDGLCVAFPTARDALDAALEGQRRLAAEAWDPAPVQVRMGLNTGPARAEDDGGVTRYVGYSTLARVSRVMSAGHGGQIVLSDRTAAQVRGDLPDGVELRDLGRHRLKGLVEPDHLWQVVVADLPQSFPRLKTLSTVTSNLPTPLTRFVGRERELVQVKDLLAENRLVSLVGPGGTGKTRLALQVAADLRDHLDDRVVVVDLSGTGDVTSVLPLIAQAVGLLEEAPGQSLLEELGEHLGDQPMLLVLDNLERLVEAGPVLTDLLRACPGLVQLVTTREALHVSGEQVFPVPPLAVPDAGGRGLALEQVAGSDAVALLVDRARAVDPTFSLTEANAPLLAELCVRLDGLPLAIELAAARLRFLSPAALVERLGSRLDLLRGGPRDAPTRQQTLRDTIDWSYEMLDEGEQRLFAVLSVFSGASVEAVEATVARVDGMAGVDVLDGLSSLVDKSLVRRVEPQGAAGRVDLLETIREFAGERLAEDPSLAERVRRAHAGWFADWTRAQWEPLTGADRQAAADALAADVENLRTAWRYWKQEQDLEQLGKLTDSLWLLYDARGWYHATAALAADLLEALGSVPSTPERRDEELTLRTSLARVLMVVKGDTQEVEAAWDRALELVAGRDEVPQILPVLRGMASFSMFRSDFAKGADLARQLLALADRHDDADARIEGHLVLGVNLAFLGRLRPGLDEIEQGIAAYDRRRHRSRPFQLGNNPGVVCFTTSAMVLWMVGRPDEARERAARAIALAEDLDHPSSIAYAHFHAGLIRLWRREPDEAEAHARTVLDLADEYDFPIWVAVGSCLRGAALADLGSGEEGLELIESAMSTYQRLQSPPIFWPLLLHLQAGACGAAGRPADGLVLQDEAIEIAVQGDGGMLASEFFCRKGDLLLAAAPREPGDAEAWFVRALEAGRAVDAPMFQLRAALRLARLWRDRGSAQEARDLLRGVYGTFTEGFGTADLVDAEALIDELAGG